MSPLKGNLRQHVWRGIRRGLGGWGCRRCRSGWLQLCGAPTPPSSAVLLSSSKDPVFYLPASNSSPLSPTCSSPLSHLQFAHTFTCLPVRSAPAFPRRPDFTASCEEDVHHAAEPDVFRNISDSFRSAWCFHFPAPTAELLKGLSMRFPLYRLIHRFSIH